eukprot:1157665-Pelagomonas_calceolata.AAC.8
MARTPVGCVHTFLQVVPQRKDHSDGVREAVELAVMSTVSHPNMLGIQNPALPRLGTRRARPHARALGQAHKSVMHVL